VSSVRHRLAICVPTFCFLLVSFFAAQVYEALHLITARDIKGAAALLLECVSTYLHRAVQLQRLHPVHGGDERAVPAENHPQEEDRRRAGGAGWVPRWRSFVRTISVFFVVHALLFPVFFPRWGSLPFVLRALFSFIVFFVYCSLPCCVRARSPLCSGALFPSACVLCSLVFGCALLPWKFAFDGAEVIRFRRLHTIGISCVRLR